MLLRLSACLCFVVAACAKPPPTVDDPLAEGEGELGEGEGEGEGEGVDAFAPFAPQADTSEGLTNTSGDLDALLERGALEGACDAWLADPDDRRKKLLCGKSMFFYEGFGTIGVPVSLYDFFGNRFPDITGTAWSSYGMVPDPTTTDPKLPLGTAPGAPFGSVPTVAFTCASCHFAQLPDGRYSVGAPNHRYEYGKQILAISIPPGSASPSFDPSAHHPDALAVAQPFIDALDADRGLRLSLLFDLLPLIGSAQPEFDTEIEGHYAHWRAGTMDFLMSPLPIDDGAHTVSKILSLWSLASAEEATAAGMQHEQLAWTGGAPTLMDFLDGFVAIGDGTASEWTHERLSPLAEYILSLRAPSNPMPPPADAVARGASVFQSSCLSCHDGPRGMGRDLYPYDEIGTDDAMKAWGDADLDGQACCGFGPSTQRIKSPRLVGLWAQTRLLHNGSVDSLEQLLCLVPRTVDTRHAQSSGGHTFGCDLAEAARRDVIAFVLAQ